LPQVAHVAQIQVGQLATRRLTPSTESRNASACPPFPIPEAEPQALESSWKEWHRNMHSYSDGRADVGVILGAMPNVETDATVRFGSVEMSLRKATMLAKDLRFQRLASLAKFAQG